MADEVDKAIGRSALESAAGIRAVSIDLDGDRKLGMAIPWPLTAEDALRIMRATYQLVMDGRAEARASDPVSRIVTPRRLRPT